MRELSEQEQFWAGEFGERYISRNVGSAVLAAKVYAFSKYLRCATGIKRTLEFGSNAGMNEQALSILIPGIKMEAVEINHVAAKQCSNIPNVKVHNMSMFDFESNDTFDLTFTSGVLIHVAPELLNQAYDKLYRYSRKYILISEYYNPTPVEVPYRGNEDKMFKRDFAGDMLGKYAGLEIIDYGFIYRRTLSIPCEDDLTWFLMRK